MISQFNSQVIIKKSPVVIVKTFIVLQMTAVAVFFLSGVLLDYGEIYDHLPLSGSVSFHIVEAAGIFFVETALVFYIFFRWYKEFYDLKSDKIVYGRGIVFRKKSVIPLRTIHSVTYNQGPLGRLTKYGTVELSDKDSNRIIMLDHIPDPQQYAELIIQLRDSVNSINTISEQNLLEDIISRGEHEKLEFKSSFRWDLNQNRVNKNLEKATIKTVAAFLNSGGGHLVIGVDDSGNVAGLADDYRSLPKQNFDGFHNHFTNVFHAMIGPEFRQFVELTAHRINGRECCLVRVMPATRPAYLRLDNGEEFYIRTGNGTTGLKLSETSSYIDSHFRGKLL